MKLSKFFDSHKLLWHLEDVVKVKNNEVISPIYIEISPVSFCNHHCNFCAKDFVQEPSIQIDIDNLISLLSYAKKHGTKSVMLAGEGEPMLHREFVTLVKRLKDIGLDISLTTNGSQGTTEIWEEVLPLLSWVRFSVNGATSKTYSEVHKTKESEFSKVLTSISNAIKVRDEMSLKTNIGIQFVVLSENKHELKEACTVFSKLNVDYLSFKPFSRNPKMIQEKDENYSQDDLKLLLEIEAIGKINQTEINCRQAAFNVYSEKNMPYDRCHALSMWSYILAKGDFYTCPIHIGNDNFKVGNINLNTPEELIFGSKRCQSVKYAREELSTKTQCRVNCRLARINEFFEEIENPPDHVNFI